MSDENANDDCFFLGWACVKQDGKETGRLREEEIRDKENLRRFVGSEMT